MLWLLLLDGFKCADYGVLALDDLGPRSALAAVASVGIFLAIDRLLASMALLPQALRRATDMRVYPQYVPPDLLLVLWNVFTAMSIIVVASTARSALSIAFKTLHVIVEASMLIFVLWHHQLRGAAAVVGSSVVAVGLVVLLYSCEVSIGWAESAGLVLDSVNFLIHLAVARSQPDNTELRRTVYGLGLHAVYLALYLVVNDLHRFVDLHLSTPLRATLRVAGMVLNLMAVYVFVALERSRLLPPSGVMTIGEWKAGRRGSSRALWVTPADVALDDDHGGEMVSLHRPYETAYVVPYTMHVANAARIEASGVLHYYSCLCSWASSRRAVEMPPDDTLVTVLSARRRDVLGFLGSVVCGVVLWSM